MKETNNKQNSVIFHIDGILNKMSNQVNFLIRNNKLMNQLDVDLLMENTRKLYDTLCSVKCNMDVDSIPMEVEEGVQEFRNSGIEEIEGFEEDEVFEEEEEFEEEEDEFEEFDEQEKEFDDEDETDYENEPETNEFETSVIEFERFEFEEEAEEEEDFRDSGVQDEDETEEVVEENYEEEEVEEEELESPKAAETESSIPQEPSDSGIRAYKKVYTIEAQTLGDKLETAVDNSLAARLQRKPVADLATAIGINDKFLLLNELFGGSMEKYNKSIRTLNNFSTLLGAKTYMSELQIEYQWDCESEAYKKLDILVERRFM